MSNERRIGYAEDENYGGGYEWSHAYVFADNGRFYIVTDSGCSCNGPASHYSDKDAVVGPAATLGGLFDELHVDQDKHPEHVKRAFIDALETLNKETIDATKSALGLR